MGWTNENEKEAFEKLEKKIKEPKVTVTLSQWRAMTDKAIDAVNDSIDATDIRDGKTPDPQSKMIVTALGINVCAELEKELFPSIS